MMRMTLMNPNMTGLQTWLWRWLTIHLTVDNHQEGSRPRWRQQLPHNIHQFLFLVQQQCEVFSINVHLFAHCSQVMNIAAMGPTMSVIQVIRVELAGPTTALLYMVLYRDMGKVTSDSFVCFISSSCFYSLHYI